MAIAFCSIQVSESNDLECSNLVGYVRHCNHAGSASAHSDHDHQYGAESALRLPTPPPAVLWNDVFCPPLSYRERTSKAHDLKQHLRNRVRLLPATLSARQYRKLVEDWVHGHTQVGVSLIVAVHVTERDAGRQPAGPIRR
jgi:hypothetical protein